MDLFVGSFGLWWEPGVGKTAPLAVAGREVGGRQLWLTLNQQLAQQTALQIARFRGDRPRMQVIGSGRDTVERGAQVIVASYDLARTMPIWRQLYGLDYSSMVLDEAHLLAHTDARRTRAVYGERVNSKGALFRRCERVWPSTGTPVMGNPRNLFPHVSRLWPDISEPSAAAWDLKYCIIQQTPHGDAVVGGKNLDELGRKLNRYSTRMTLEQAYPDMPGLVADEIPVTVSPAMLDEIRREVDADPETMQQLEIALAQMEGGDAAADCALQAMLLPTASLRRLLALAKAPGVAQLAEAELEAGLDRIVVAGLHVDGLRTVARHLSGYGARLLMGRRWTSQAEKEAALADFVAGRCRALVINMESGGTGLDGMQACRRMLFLEGHWNPDINRQAIGRVRRAGQRRSVHASFASASGTIDQRVQQVSARKVRINTEILQEVS
jgi:superfamily II DNA or RNA helicase